MDVSTVITICGFILTISVNVALVARWSGKTTAQISAMQEDIRRLEKKQDESNKVKERIAVGREQQCEGAYSCLRRNSETNASRGRVTGPFFA